MSKQIIKLLTLILVLLMVFSSVSACRRPDPANTGTPEPTDEPTGEPTDDPGKTTELPRKETLYFGGQQWGTVNGWNPLGDNNNNAMALASSGSGSRTIMFETLYMYNFLDGSMIPLLADGDYVWNEDRTEMTVKIKKAAKWSDGTPVTAEDVAYTYETCVKIGNNAGNANKPYIETIEVKDSHTIVIKAVKNEEGKAANPLMLVNFLGSFYIAQKAWIQKVEERNNNDPTKIKNDPGEDVVYSGPYGKYFADDQKVVFIRNDNYWGKDPSMWGKLPAPKYIVHAIYADNAATEVAFKAGEIDVNQQFIANIQDLWLKDGLPISTYIDEPPYGICVNMPTAFYNLDNPVLQKVELRKAIAIAVDYDAIIANAMTGQSPSFRDVPRSLMNPTEAEQSTYDREAVKDLQWVGNDIEGAKKLLDDAGIIDTDGDGFREYNGEKISLVAACPNGWSDWQAAIEIVAAAGKNIGIEITTQFPEADTYLTTVTSAHQDDFDIFMMWTDSASPIQPWGRLRYLMSNEFNGLDNNWSGNYGHYSNDRIQELIKLIPLETDPNKLKEYYTEAVRIYLTDVPSFSLMYRPDKFHAVNESVWTGFPEKDDGLNIPPTCCTDGYGIAALYHIKPIE